MPICMPGGLVRTRKGNRCRKYKRVLFSISLSFCLQLPVSKVGGAYTESYWGFLVPGLIGDLNDGTTNVPRYHQGTFFALHCIHARLSRHKSARDTRLSGLTRIIYFHQPWNPRAGGRVARTCSNSKFES